MKRVRLLQQWFDRWQRRGNRRAFVVGVVKKFQEDRAGQLAALIAYYSFFSLFPLLLVLTTSLGYLLDGNPDLQERIAGSALSRIPVVGDSLQTGALQGRGAGLAVGLFGALWAGMGAMVAAQNAMNSVWDLPRKSRPGFFSARLRALIMLAVLGVGLIGSVVLSAVASALGGLPIGAHIVLALGNVALNVAVIGLAFKVLTDRPLTVRQIWPGALVAGVVQYGFQMLGTQLVAERIKGASDVYGTFATVIGLLTYFYALAQVLVFAAEINVVRDARLYPRSMFGGPPTEADLEAHQRRLRAGIPDPTPVE